MSTDLENFGRLRCAPEFVRVLALIESIIFASSLAIVVSHGNTLFVECPALAAWMEFSAGLKSSEFCIEAKFGGSGCCYVEV